MPRPTDHLPITIIGLNVWGWPPTGVRLDWLATGRRPVREDPSGASNSSTWSEGTVLIPRYDAHSSTGPGGDIDASPIVEQVPFPEHFIRRVLNRNPADLALVDIGGDSTTPTLFDGDRALVDTSVRDSGAGKIYMRAIGNALLAKRRLDGSVLVISDNTRHWAETVSHPRRRRCTFSARSSGGAER